MLNSSAIKCTKYCSRLTVKNFTENYKFDFQQYWNLPIPFNPSTVITYQLKALSRDTHKVYDIIGNEIETLFSEEEPKGIYQVNLNAANLPSGIYFKMAIKS